MNEIQKLPPFKRFCITIGAIPATYIESLSYYETLLWLCKYLQDTVIPAINTNAAAVTELQTAFETLQSYVDSYFENLDIQTEVNNKIDEMVEAGELQEIIVQYLQVAGVLGYDTIAAMVASANISEGSICRTLGESSYMDGKGAFYKVRTVTSGDVVDGVNIVALDVSDTLIAEKIPDYYINTINTQISSINSNLELINNGKLLIIGDSFIDEYPNNNWGLKLVNLMGLSSGDYTILGEGGAGIYNVGNQSTNFLGLLQANISNITDKDKYTKIIIGGGYNDGNATSASDILTPMEQLITYCKTQFPNAKIYLSEFGWNMKYDGITFRQRINGIVIPTYKQASKFGAYYLNNVEFCYRDMNLYESTDPVNESVVHPNDDGQREIAQAIYDALTTGYTPRYKSSNIAFDASTSSDINSANIRFFHQVTTTNHVLTLNGNFGISKTYNPNNGLSIDLGLMPDPLIRRSATDLQFIANVTGRVYTTSNAVYYVNIQLNYNSSGHVIANIPRGLTTSNVDLNSLVIVDTVTFDRYMW